MLQHREVLGDLHRVVRGDQRGRGGQLQGAGDTREVTERGRRRRGEERRVVVLAEGEDVETDLLGVPGDGQDVLNALRLGRGGAGRRVRRDVADREDSELHGFLK